MKKRFVESQYVASLVGLISTMLFLFPVYWMFVTSIKPMSAIFAIPPQLIPREVTTDAYMDNILSNPEIVRFFSIVS